jgi:uncharacterized protein (DUF1697 family)
MTVHVALLRAVNVGGTGKLPMAELKRLCEEAGFAEVRTYIQSGNVLFASDLSAAKVRSALEGSLKSHFGKEAGVFIRSAGELRRLVRDNPFPDAPGNRVGVIFLDVAPTGADLEKVTAPGGEEVKAGAAAAYVFFPNGMGTSKLRLPFAAKGTMRNMNTVAKLADMAADSK